MSVYILAYCVLFAIGIALYHRAASHPAATKLPLQRLFTAEQRQETAWRFGGGADNNASPNFHLHRGDDSSSSSHHRRHWGDNNRRTATTAIPLPLSPSCSHQLAVNLNPSL